MKARLALFIPVCIFALLAGFFWRGLSLDPTAMPSALVDKPVPSFALPTVMDSNKIIKDTDLLGQSYLLNVWATWCVTCRHEHPYLNELAENGVPIYGVNYKDDVVEAQRWLTNLGDPYVATIVDADGRLGIDLGVFGAPETYFVDQQGIIRYKHVGVVDPTVWQETIKPLFDRYQ